MGYKIPAGIAVKPTPKLMLASAGDVQRQVLGQHWAHHPVQAADGLYQQPA